VIFHNDIKRAVGGEKMKRSVSIDLHLHLDGSLSVSTARALADMQGISVPKEDGELRRLLTVNEGCRDLREYLERFEFPLSLLQTEGAMEEATRRLCRELVAEGCIYAEIRFAPQLHTRCGLSMEDATKAAIIGFERSGLAGGLILCCMRGEGNREQNLATVALAHKYLGHKVLALDLAGNEAGYPNADFADVFELARKYGIPFTIHAGEADGAHSVRKAVELGAARIGHGVRAIEDGDVIKLLVDKKIPLELCATSNLNTAIFEDISVYPIRALMAAGVTVTVNSDNRSVSATSAGREMSLLRESFGLTDEEEKQLLINSVNAAFCDEGTKKKLIKQIK
jgi:adenosine deaminase